MLQTCSTFARNTLPYEARCEGVHQRDKWDIQGWKRTCTLNAFTCTIRKYHITVFLVLRSQHIHVSVLEVNEYALHSRDTLELLVAVREIVYLRETWIAVEERHLDRPRDGGWVVT